MKQRIKCFFGFHDYKAEKIRSAGIVPVYKPRMGWRQVLLTLPVCRHCGKERTWSMYRKFLGRYL